MTNEKQTKTGSELCTIRIMFPVTSDEQAIEYKKKIREALGDNPDVQMQFGITTAPPRMTPT